MPVHHLRGDEQVEVVHVVLIEHHPRTAAHARREGKHGAVLVRRAGRRRVAQLGTGTVAVGLVAIFFISLRAAAAAQSRGEPALAGRHDLHLSRLGVRLARLVQG